MPKKRATLFEEVNTEPPRTDCAYAPCANPAVCKVKSRAGAWLNVCNDHYIAAVTSHVLGHLDPRETGRTT